MQVDAGRKKDDKGEDCMKKKVYIALVLGLIMSGQVYGQTPLPTFDKEAVTEYPYARRGDQTVVTKDPSLETVKRGNTGTAENPAFFVKDIRLTGFALPDKEGSLTKILDQYRGRSVKVAELSTLQKKITEYAKNEGYPVSAAVIPPQEVKDGNLMLTVYVARYDDVTLTENTTDVADTVLEGYLRKLKKGDILTDRKLEGVMNTLNDLPGVTARGILRPGSMPGTTSLDVEAVRRPVWNNYVFVDNGGGYYSGRYRYGVHTEINNLGKNGDKVAVSGMMTSHDTQNYSVLYETPLAYTGTRLGFAVSRSEYELHTNDFYTSLGRSDGISVYGITPLYRDRMNRLTAIYGYDDRRITDRYRFRDDFFPELKTKKRSHVWHAGISGSQYYPNEFLQYDLIYWQGHMKTNGGAYYDGTYHKLTGSLLKVWYDGPWNYRIRFQGQLANRALDGSEQFYLGGMDGIRAYGNNDGYGDDGWISNFEIRRSTGIEGLEAAAFLDTGYVKNQLFNEGEHLSGWGLGLRYHLDGEWYGQLDWARKINGQRDASEPKDHNNRWWFALYRLF